MRGIQTVTHPGWHGQAACREADPGLMTPEEETAKAFAVVKRDFCDRCPVRITCLHSALAHRDTGFWGGTSTEQRMRLLRIRNRAVCPVCGGKKLVRAEDDPDGPHQMCIGCGASWRAEDAPPAAPPERAVRTIPGKIEDVPLEGSCL